MKNILTLLIILILSLPVYSYDLISSVVLDSGMSKDLEAGSQISGDIWLRLSEFDYFTADIDYQFGKNTSKINVAQAKLLFVPEVDVVVGRQQIGWGVGYALNPVDIINPKPVGSSFDPSFVRDGRDAIALTKYFGEFNKIELIGAGRLEEEKFYDDETKIEQSFDADAGIKIKGNIFDYDVAAVYIDKGKKEYNSMLLGTSIEVIEEQDKLLGFELSGSLPLYDMGFWIESANYSDSEKYDYIIGTDYYWEDYHATLEYYKNGFGQYNRESYDTTLLFRGKLLGQDYLIPSFSWTVDEKLTLTSYSFWNLNDGGTIIGGVIDYFYNDNVEFILIPILLSGADDSEVGIQTEAFGNYAIKAMIKCVF